MKSPAFKKLPVIVKELFCRLGRDWHSERLFIGELRGFDSEIAHLVAEELKINPEDLHRLTCNIKAHREPSITGDDYLASKILKLKIRVTVEEYELIDDIPAESEKV